MADLPTKPETEADPMSEKRRSSVVERPAGFFRRWVAMVVDHFLIFFCQIPTFLLTWFFLGGTLLAIGKSIKQGADPQSVVQGPTMILFIVTIVIAMMLWSIITTAYYGWFNRNRGGSPGKLFMDLRLRDKETQSNLTYGQTFLRDVFWKSWVPTSVSLVLTGFALILKLNTTVADVFSLLFWFIFMSGFVMAGLRKDKRAFHDLMFGTEVVQRLEIRG